MGTNSFVSSNGKSWTQGGSMGARYYDVDYADGLYVAVGANSSQSDADGRVTTSTDGVSWTNRTPGTIEQLNAVRHAAGRWVAVGNNNTNDHGATVLESENGVNWDVDYMNFDGDLFGLEAANGFLIAVGQNGAVMRIPYEDTDSPYITAQPISQTVNEGGSLALEFNFGGLEPVEIQWFKDGQPIYDNARIAAARSFGPTIEPVTLEDAGFYWAVITNSAGSTSTDVVEITVNGLPNITAHPVSVTTGVGGSAQFSIAVTNLLTVQWYHNGVLMPGETGDTLSLTNVQEAGRRRLLRQGNQRRRLRGQLPGHSLVDQLRQRRLHAGARQRLQWQCAAVGRHLGL